MGGGGAALAEHRDTNQCLQDIAVAYKGMQPGTQSAFDADSSTAEAVAVQKDSPTSPREHA